MEKISARKPKKPRKIMKVKNSKYESSEAIHQNKKYWEKVFEEIDAACKMPTKEDESSRLSRVLPSDLYTKVCSTLDIPVANIMPEEPKVFTDTSPRRLQKQPMISFRTTLHVDRELDSDTDVEFYPSDEEDQPNVHQELLSKPVREQITWPSHYLMPEKEEEKSLVKKADDLTDRIAKEFCEYMTQLGGNQQSQLLTPKAIKELFQIEFDTPIARGLQVVPKELPSVIQEIAEVTGNPEKSVHAVLEREIERDIKAERRPEKLRAFGRQLTFKDQWRMPRNDTEHMWRSARHVPRDLVTLKTVWEGITNLRSVREYCRWMIEHPEYRRAPYLRSLGMFDTAVLNARQANLRHEDLCPTLNTNDDTPAPIDQLRRRLSVFGSLE